MQNSCDSVRRNMRPPETAGVERLGSPSGTRPSSRNSRLAASTSTFPSSSMQYSSAVHQHGRTREAAGQTLRPHNLAIRRLHAADEPSVEIQVHQTVLRHGRRHVRRLARQAINFLRRLAHPDRHQVIAAATRPVAAEHQVAHDDGRGHRAHREGRATTSSVRRCADRD